MILRILTAIVALAVVVPILLLGGVPGAQLLCVVAAGLGLWEYGALQAPPATKANRVFAIVLAALPILAAGMTALPFQDGQRAYGSDWVLLALGIAVLAIPIQSVLQPGEIEGAPGRMARTLFGVAYLGFTLAFCVMLRALPNGLLWIVMGLACVWLGDTGAYVGGRAFGRHKLHPRVSPGKTWEGSVLGILTSIAAGFAVRAVIDVLPQGWGWTGPRLDVVDVLVVSVLAGALGQVGDLAESLLKRAAGVKDSGAMFPGHGGMLDRIDALLFALPGVYFFAKFFFV